MITLIGLKLAFKEYFPKFDEEKLNELINMSVLEDKQKIKFEEFYKIWEKASTVL